MPEITPGMPERHDDDARLLDGPSAPALDGAVAGDSSTQTQPAMPAAGPDESPRRSARSGRRGAGEAETADASQGSPFLGWLKEIGTVVAIAVVLSFLIKTFLFRAFFI